MANIFRKLPVRFEMKQPRKREAENEQDQNAI